MASGRDALKGLDLKNGSNAGLLLARYLREQSSDDAGIAARNELFSTAISAVNKAKDIYTKAFNQRKEALDGTSASFKLSGRMIVGLGSSSVLETGLTLNHLYGTPIIPGSALKGLAAHFSSSLDDEQKRFILGYTGDGKDSDLGNAGYITFHDAWIEPPRPPKNPFNCLHMDIMTPHHMDYYDDGKDAPTDFDSPNPVSFLSVSGAFHIIVSCNGCDEDLKNRRLWEKFTLEILRQALVQWGIGGKTSSGYGLGELGPDTTVEPPKAPQTYTVVCTDVNKKGNCQFVLDGKKVQWDGGAVPKVSKGDTLEVIPVSENPLIVKLKTPPS